MKKTLRAIIAVLCVILALCVAFLIYLKANNPNSSAENTSPSTQNTAPSAQDHTSPSEDAGVSTSPATTTQAATMPTFQTEDPTAVMTPEITFPEEEPDQTQSATETQSTTGVDTDYNATPDIDF